MFPSVISTFNVVSATDRLNSPSHSALHNSVSSVLTQVQTVIGIEGASSVLGTLMTLIKSPGSDGGGHVQSANKGGTGQTSYNKGEILAASSASVLSKLAAGLDGQVLVANSSVAAGVNWANTSTGKIATSATASITGQGVVTEQSVLSVSIPGSVLGTNNAVRATVFVSGFGTGTASSVLVQANYDGNAVASVMLGGEGNGRTLKGKIEYVLIANASATAQRGNVLIDLNLDRLNTSGSVLGVSAFETGTSSVQSSANQTLGITARFSDTNTANGIAVNGYTIEKIV